MRESLHLRWDHLNTTVVYHRAVYTPHHCHAVLLSSGSIRPIRCDQRTRTKALALCQRNATCQLSSNNQKAQSDYGLKKTCQITTQSSTEQIFPHLVKLMMRSFIQLLAIVFLSFTMYHTLFTVDGACQIEDMFAEDTTTCSSIQPTTELTMTTTTKRITTTTTPRRRRTITTPACICPTMREEEKTTTEAPMLGKCNESVGRHVLTLTPGSGHTTN